MTRLGPNFSRTAASMRLALGIAGICLLGVVTALSIHHSARHPHSLGRLAPAHKARHSHRATVLIAAASPSRPDQLRVDAPSPIVPVPATAVSLRWKKRPAPERSTPPTTEALEATTLAPPRIQRTTIPDGPERAAPDYTLSSNRQRAP